jgi:hypothetical protein
LTETLTVILIVAGAIGALGYVISRPSHYSKMTEGEFEADTKRSSILGAVVIGLERSLRRREAEYMIEEKLRNDKDATPVAGEPPEDTPQLKRPAHDSTI